MNLEKRTLLRGFTDDELKAELSRRRTLERAKRHLSSAETSLKRAQDKVNEYRTVLEEDKALQRARMSGRQREG
jgi:hypothetical protein